MSLSLVYILFVVTSVLLFNALIVMSRYVQQTKKAPEEADYLTLEHTRRELEGLVDRQHQEIAELQLQVEETQKKAEAERAAAAESESAQARATA